MLPQNENLRAEWQAILGPDWKQVQQTWLNRLGNITLTGYNSEYSDRAFDEKKKIEGGFNDSPLRLNKFIREQNKWTATEIEERGKYWADRATKIWPALVVDEAAIKKAELEDKKAVAAKYTVESLDLDEIARPLFDELRPQIVAIDLNAVELFSSKSVSYRVYDFFVEVLPRKHRLLLLLNLDFSECNDPSGLASDATDNAWISNASESGGVLFNLREIEDIPAAIHVVRQAYEKVAE